MPQLNFVEQATRSPTGCLLCGTQKGPFIDCHIPQITFWSATGNQTIDSYVYVCVGSEENPGCSVQMGRITGALVDRGVVADLQDMIEGLNSEVADLRNALLKKQLKVEDVIASGLILRAEPAAA